MRRAAIELHDFIARFAYRTHAPRLYRYQQRSNTMANVSRQLSEGFILTVGITPPRPGKERSAGRYITSMLVLIVAAAAGMFGFILTRLL
jgi:hypothetical protein